MPITQMTYETEEVNVLPSPPERNILCFFYWVRTRRVTTSLATVCSFLLFLDDIHRPRTYVIDRSP